MEDAFADGIGLRPRLLLAVLLAGLVLVAAAGGLAWHQYDGARRSAVDNARARVILASSIVDTYFAGQLATLESIARSATVRAGDSSAMNGYFRRVQPRAGGPFAGGLGWIDRHGFVRASSSAPSRPLDLSDRAYYEVVRRTGAPFVSEGLASRRTHRRIIVMAVPTHDRLGHITGVLTGALFVDGFRVESGSSDLGFDGLVVLDRRGRELLANFTRPRNAALQRRLQQTQVGLLSGVRGLDDGSDHVLVFATAQVPGWTIAIDRPRSEMFAAAWHGFLLALALLASAAAAVFGFVGWLLLRARREAENRSARARQRGELSHAFSTASLAAEVSQGLVASLSAAFPGSLAVVALEGENRRLLLSAAEGDAGRLSAEAHELVAGQACARAYESGAAFALEDERRLREELPDLHGTVQDTYRSLHCVPLRPSGSRALGALCLLFEDERALGEAESAQVDWCAQEASQALARARTFEHEHAVAVSLQRGLLSELLPEIDGVELLGHYQAGGAGLEVGGDWYDVVRRSDGIVEISVGDVAGRGLNAAVLMGQMRNAFRAYAFDHSSPAEILRRMQRHLRGDAMVTAVCIALDPYTCEMTYASAGHPPVLLAGGTTGEKVARLDQAGAPPLGFSEAGDFHDVQVSLTPAATAVAYTDGLIERRDWSLDVGIDLLAQAVASASASGPGILAEAIVRDVVGRVGSGDDIAFLIVRTCGVPEGMDIEIPADPSVLAHVRRRLRRWLALRGLSEQEREDAVLSVSEACNNAIEHGYRGEQGTIHLVFDHRAGALQITIEDRGNWRAPRQEAERGRGIAIMRAVMEDADIAHEHGRTRVLLTQRLVNR
ncbi:MAG TPA: SpoIIE family protein phosphatase [Gaiellales bacterium]|nr:SpoIIE family protein phosphatase [Gaiellales bacterium]